MKAPSLEQSRRRSDALRLPPDLTPSDLTRTIFHLRAAGEHEMADILASYLPPSDPFAHFDVPAAPQPTDLHESGEPGSVPAGGLPKQVPHPDNENSEGSLPPKVTKAHDPSRLSCVYLLVPEPLRSRVLALGRLIPDSDLAEGGREEEPHCTAFFGLHDSDPAPVFEILSHFRPVRLRTGKIGVFHRDDYDVLKIDVESDQIRRMNAAFRNLPHTSEFRNFVPHITIAYVKKGLGPVYALSFNDLDDECVCGTAILSDPDHNHAAYPLGRMITVQKAAMSYLHGECGGALVPPSAMDRASKVQRNKKRLKRILKDALGDLNIFNPHAPEPDSDDFDPEDFVFGKSDQPRETTFHDGKRPGEFAPIEDHETANLKNKLRQMHLERAEQLESDVAAARSRLERHFASGGKRNHPLVGIAEALIGRLERHAKERRELAEGKSPDTKWLDEPIPDPESHQ